MQAILAAYQTMKESVCQRLSEAKAVQATHKSAANRAMKESVRKGHSEANAV